MHRPRLLALVLLLALGWMSSAQETKQPVLPARPEVKASEKAGDPLAEYRTVDTAITTRIARSVNPSTERPVEQPRPKVESKPLAYLGLQAQADGQGRLKVADLQPNGPAVRDGLRLGDILLKIDDQPVKSPENLHALLGKIKPESICKVEVLRGDKPATVQVKTAAVSRPLQAPPAPPPQQRVVFGVATRPARDGLELTEVRAQTPAATAGFKVGDVLLKIDGKAIKTSQELVSTVTAKKVGETITVTYKRGDKEAEVKVKLAGDGGTTTTANQNPRGWTGRRYFTRDTYRLAVVCIEFPDVPHNEKITKRDWEWALFSKGIYNDKNASGRPVHGSLNDYWSEQSCGRLTITGKVFDWIKVSRKREEYGAQGRARQEMFTEAVDALLARDGKNALNNFDGIFFMHAGDRVRTQRGGLFWPHKSTFAYKNQRWNYFICPEGGRTQANISVIAHEFGHMLGLPDLYAPPERPGVEGLSIWCTMANGHGNAGRPRHVCAWVKEQLGWLKPAVIDPTVKQKLILAPVNGSTKECYKVLLHPDGSEYLLLENRVRKGFDVDLPAEGLLIWRVHNGRPVLEESHGIEGPRGPTLFREVVPYPSKSNDSFTPFTQPSSRSLKGGGLPVHITNIRKLPDGRITFWIGYEYF